MSTALTSMMAVKESDYRSLISGRMIAWKTDFFMPFGQSFALANASIIESQMISYWGRCDRCQAVESADLPQISQLTGWGLDALSVQMEQQGFIFIACLRIHKLSRPVEITVYNNVGFTPLNPVIITDDVDSVLSESIFQRRKLELLESRPPLHSELIQLEKLLTQSTISLSIQPLLNKIHQLLGWGYSSKTDSDIDWVEDIAAVGNSSDGHNFEKVVRRSLIFLGFTNSINNHKASLDPESTGGAGGLDFYCDTPYQVVGECKASKTDTVPDGTPAQLVKLGFKILGEKYPPCIKILMVAGTLTTAANQTARGNSMNVIRPETLQKLVQLQIAYPGAIDLIALKPCLTAEPFGDEADNKINIFIAKILSNLQLRSDIIELVKDSLDRSQKDSESVEALYAIFIYNQSEQKLSQQEFRDILVELASPLAGYLGKLEKEQFYFLRSLNLSSLNCLEASVNH
jgi:hypothetical protein